MRLRGVETLLRASSGGLKRRSIVMPVPGLDPGIVAGIHVFLSGDQACKTLMAGTSPAMTPEK
jgi:hypothetical protein